LTIFSEKEESTGDREFFVLKAKNLQIIAKSQLYTSPKGLENGIQSVMKNGSTTLIEDLS
jgi:uncharacterized protein YegP (UPF0339 family)